MNRHIKYDEHRVNGRGSGPVLMNRQRYLVQTQSYKGGLFPPQITSNWSIRHPHLLFYPPILLQNYCTPHPHDMVVHIYYHPICIIIKQIGQYLVFIYTYKLNHQKWNVLQAYQILFTWQCFSSPQGIKLSIKLVMISSIYFLPY